MYHSGLNLSNEGVQMAEAPQTDPLPLQSVPVLAGPMLDVVDGANMGDTLSIADDLVHDDVYMLAPSAGLQRLEISATADGGLCVGTRTQTGTPGAALHVDCCLTLMSPGGETTEALVLVEVDGTGHIAAISLLPLALLAPKTEYRLVGIDTDKPRSKLAQVACVSFSRGTHITLASGAQKPIEELRVGDKVLTRDDGPQEIRWIGSSTTRAVGEFAPIVITAGALHNAHDLVVSPDHRLFIYQRTDTLGAGRSELLVKARHLVDGETVYRQDGGFVDYFQLLFDRHQIIYAEGIAAESLLIDTRTEAALPRDVAGKLNEVLRGHDASLHRDFEVQETLVRHPNAAELLRRASTR